MKKIINNWNLFFDKTTSHWIFSLYEVKAEIHTQMFGKYVLNYLWQLPRDWRQSHGDRSGYLLNSHPVNLGSGQKGQHFYSMLPKSVQTFVVWVFASCTKGLRRMLKYTKTGISHTRCGSSVFGNSCCKCMVQIGPCLHDLFPKILDRQCMCL